MRAISTETREKIIRLARQGLTDPEIFKQCMVNGKKTIGRSTLQKIRLNAGIPAKFPRNKRYDHNEIVNLDNRGFSPTKIAEQLGCSYSAISKVLTKAGRRKKERNINAGPEENKREERFDYRAYLEAFKEEMRKDCCPEMSPSVYSDWLRTDEGQANFEYWSRVVEFQYVPEAVAA